MDFDDIDWQAVAVGILVSLVIGLLAGFSIPLTDLTLPAVSWFVTGLVAGAAAGYVSGGGVSGGAVHGILGTTIGAVLVTLALALLGTLLFGLVGLSMFVVPLLLLGLYAIPGAIGGAIGAVLKGTPTVETSQPAR